ncbi:MAG: HAMP domain-containing protein [Lachnospiraceae bacterium]|nr:HAMP domain-containing protein [Lachnospiraceae bacterium]
MKKKIFRHSLSQRITVNMILYAVLLNALLITLTYFYYKEKMFDKYETFATNIARTAASQLDPDKIQHYLDTGEKDEEYETAYDTLCDIHQNSGIMYLYVVKPEPDEVWYVLDTDQTEGAIPLGYHEPYYKGAFAENAERMVKGEKIDPIISNEEFGWLMSVYSPMFTSKGEPAGYVGVDILMNEVISDLHTFVWRMAMIMVVITLLVSLLMIYYSSKTIAKPIQNLAEASKELVIAEQSGSSNETNIFQKLSVRSKDEIGELYHSLSQMEKDMNAYIRDLLSVTAEKERITTELSLATRIQGDMLPNIFPAFPERKEFDIYATMSPARAVGGDFYDFFLVDSDHLCMVMADVSGKGIPAALFMMASKIILANNAMLGKSPAEVLTSTNTAVCSNNREEMFVTVWMGILELSTGILRAANAGHEYPVIKQPDGNFELFKDKHGFVIGGMDGIRYKEYEVQLQPGAKLFLYTDGLTEATNISNEMFGAGRMVEALNVQKESSPEIILHEMKNSVDRFVKEAEQFDDLTMMCMEYKGSGDPGNTYELEVGAKDENLAEVMQFLEERLDEAGCSVKAKMQILVAAEEIFVNIAHYAYAPADGNAKVRMTIAGNPACAEISFIDQGMPYDPLSKEDPDITLSVEERPIGGLGVYITKKTMDEVYYRFEEGQNILTLKKILV